MTDQAEDVELHPAQVVANLFIQQYYLSIHKAPDEVHKFYVDSSVLSRPGPTGLMTTAATVQAIDDLVRSLKYNDHHTQILTVDAQFSHNDGVIIMVTGCLTGKNERRKFSQTFFLAPQIQDKVTKGYYVLNDVFRFIDDIAGNVATDEISQSPVETPIVELSAAADEPAPSEGSSVEVEVNPSFPESQVAQSDSVEKEPVFENVGVALENGCAEENGHVDSSKSVAENIITEAPVATVQEDAPKKSFASVVNALNKNSAPFHVRAPLHKPAVQPLPRQPAEIKPEAPTTEVPAAVVDAAPERNDDHAGKAHAIFVANLPMSATVEELDKLFKQFGPIKPHGIQVRSNKQQGTCFGFVEFESASSLQSALEASPVVFGARKLSIEERRANNERAKYPSGRSGYRNDGFRGGRGNYNGNGNGNRGAGGYRRNDFEKRGEFVGRARSNNEVTLKPATTGADKAMHEAPVLAA